MTHSPLLRLYLFIYACGLALAVAAMCVHAAEVFKPLWLVGVCIGLVSEFLLPWAMSHRRPMANGAVVLQMPRLFVMSVLLLGGHSGLPACSHGWIAGAVVGMSLLLFARWSSVLSMLMAHAQRRRDAEAISWVNLRISPAQR